MPRRNSNARRRQRPQRISRRAAKRIVVGTSASLVFFVAVLASAPDVPRQPPILDPPAPSASQPATPTPEPTTPAPTTPAPTPEPPAQEVPGGLWTVTRVADGDTFTVTRDGVETTIRLIGVDTPETVHPRKPVECGGPEASAEAKRLLTGQQVRLVADPTQGRYDEETGTYLDRYDRTLAYVEVNGLDLGQHLIEAGLAEEYTYDEVYARRDAYLAAEERARAAGIGVHACPKEA